jgi:hypothetical protein
MLMTTVYLNLQSANIKTGPIPVSTTSAATCPPSCPLMGNGCYAGGGPLGILWRAVSRARAGTAVRLPSGGKLVTLNWRSFCRAIARLPVGTVWRHNQAGDLPGIGDRIDARQLASLAASNRGKRGFTYTHKPTVGPHGRDNRRAIRRANAAGFTVNVSADNLGEADMLAKQAIAPVVVVLPSTVSGNVKVETPAGRRVVVCPATYRDDVTCETCKLCAVRDRPVIVGFPAHGASHKRASAIAAQ